MALGRWDAKPEAKDGGLADLQRRFATLARERAMTVCAVGPVDDPRSDAPNRLLGGAALYGPDGTRLVAADPAIEQTVAHTFELEPSSRREEDQCC